MIRPLRTAPAVLLAAALYPTGCAPPAERAPLLVVSNEVGGSLSLVDTASLEVVAEIEVGRRPRGVRVAPGGRLAYVALSGSPRCPPWMDEDECGDPDKTYDGIAEVDLESRELVRILPGGSDPETFDLTPDGARMVVSNEDADEASLVDVASGRIIRTVPVGREPEGVRISPDGTLAYVTGETDHDVTVLATSSGEEIARIRVGERPRDAVFTRDGARAYVSAEIAGTVSEIIVAEHRVERTFRLPEDSRSMGVALSPDDRTLYVTNGRTQTLSVLDLDRGELVGSAEVGERPWGVAVSSDGSRIYTANGPSNDISVIEASTLRVIARVPVGESPWGVALTP